MIINTRRYPKKFKEYRSEIQFDFCDGLVTRAALFGMSMLAKRCYHVSIDVYCCFIHFQKECVMHSIMIEALRDFRLDIRDVRILANLY